MPALVVGLALVAFVAGFFALDPMSAGGGHSGHGGQAAASAELGGLTLQVELAEWVRHDMLGGPTPPNAGPFRMPMTGIGNMPAEGMNRFHVEVLIANHGDALQTLSEDDFRLSSSGKLWPPNLEDQIAEGHQDQARRQRSLAPRQVTDIDLFFDLPERSSEPVLVWTRAGEQSRVGLEAGPAPEHQH